MTEDQTDWRLFKRDAIPHDAIEHLPDAPPWRSGKPGSLTLEQAGLEAEEAENDRRGAVFQSDEKLIDTINAALYLRRPLLITGKPGLGKSAVAYAIAHQLKLGPVLRWTITSRSTRQEGLYHYDALARLQESQLPAGDRNKSGISEYITLGPLGTALLPWKYPRVLLIDELDKADIDLPNDLLEALEEGEYLVPELKRDPNGSSATVPGYKREATYQIDEGIVTAGAFPVIVMTSNEERDFPPAFLRRCLRFKMPEPDADMLRRIVSAHFTTHAGQKLKSAFDESALNEMLETFLQRRETRTLANDQLLQALYLRLETGTTGTATDFATLVMQGLDQTLETD